MLSDLTSSSSNDDIYNDKMDIDRMEPPLHTDSLPLIIKREEKVKYKQLLIPNGMRSSYWKYFGFPSEDGRTYLTKQKVVCALCSTLLAYNKNTTNLKSHLISKHRDIVKKSDLIIRSKKEIQKKIKEEPVDDDDTDDLLKNDLVPRMSPTSSNMAHDDTETSDLIDELDFEPGEIRVPTETADHLFIIDEENLNSNDKPTHYDDVQQQMLNITSSNQTIADENTNYAVNLMTNMIVTDLLPISTISGLGFQNLMLNLLPTPVPKSFEIETQLNLLIDKRKAIVQTFIHGLTKTKQFTLIVNKFKTSTHDEYLVAIVNFINIETKIQKFDHMIELDVSKIEQKCYVYNIVRIKNSVFNYAELFANLNLNKCIAIIINYFNHTGLIDFLLENNLNNNKIIIVPNFLDIIKNLIKNIFYRNISGVEAIFNQISDLPNIYGDLGDTWNYNNWYSRWMLLDGYMQSYGLRRDELTDLVSMLTDVLHPLKVTLELLQNEDIIPNASLIKPLIMQLLENHFKINYDTDNDMVREIKEMVNKELTTRLMESPILSVLSFLDPRFTHLLTAPEIDYVREFLREKLEENLSYEERKSLKKPEASNTSSTTGGGGSLLSALDYFFILKKPKMVKNNKFDHEFEKFMNETSTSLEQCPITWWAEYGYFYPLLSQLAKLYTNIPACYLERHKIGTAEYFKYHKKRYLLEQCTEQILYLNLTEDHVQEIQSSDVLFY